MNLSNVGWISTQSNLLDHNLLYVLQSFGFWVPGTRFPLLRICSRHRFGGGESPEVTRILLSLKESFKGREVRAHTLRVSEGKFLL